MIFWKRAIQGKTPQIAFVKSNETKYVFRELASLCIGANHPILLKYISSKKTWDEY